MAGLSIHYSPAIPGKSSIIALTAILFFSFACGGGSGDNGAYGARVVSYQESYGKSDAWAEWMLANRARYAAAFAASASMPETVTISFRYESAPIAYDPAWTDEAEHMDVFTTMAQGAYPGYNFNLVFGGNPTASYANIIAGTSGMTSYAFGKDVYLYYETIFNHEFGHVMKLLHHYDSVDQIGAGMHMPPGDSKCIMDRNSTLFCSACRTALGLPLDVSDTVAMDAAMSDILGRYPY